MKVALCLSGQPRFYNSASYDSIKKEILDVYHPDVFIHMWFKKNYEYNCAPWSGLTNVTIPNTAVDEIIKLYNPKKIKVDEPKEFTEFVYDDGYLSKNIPSMLYSLKQSFYLKEEYQAEKNIKYDWIIRARFDTIISDLPDLITLDNNKFYAPNNRSWNPSAICDSFYFCNNNVASTTFNLFDNIKKYSYLKYVPEDTLQQYLIDNKISFEKLNFHETYSRSWN